MIQQINHHALSHAADVDGYYATDAQTTTITKSITAKSDDITGQKLPLPLEILFQGRLF